MNNTALATTIDDRIYTPSTIEEAFNGFPAPGRRIKIEYDCEYTSGGNATKKKKRTRTAIVLPKVNRTFFTVEVQPENIKGHHGRYRLAFLFADILTGYVKVQPIE